MPLITISLDLAKNHSTSTCTRGFKKIVDYINSSLTVLLIYGILYLQQSSLTPVWLFLNEMYLSVCLCMRQGRSQGWAWGG